MKWTIDTSFQGFVICHLVPIVQELNVVTSEVRQPVWHKLQDSVQIEHYFQISIVIGVLLIFLAPLFQGEKLMHG